jgi:hypothetical protein
VDLPEQLPKQLPEQLPEQLNDRIGAFGLTAGILTHTNLYRERQLL